MKTLLIILLTISTTIVKAQHEIEIWNWTYVYDYATSKYTKEKREYRTTERYNNKGQLIETHRYQYTNVYDYTILEYNDAGQKMKEMDYRGLISDSTPKQSVIRNYAYNEQGLLASMAYKSWDKKYDTEISEFYTYEGTNLVKKVKTINPYKSSETWTYTYEMVKGNKRVIEIHTLPGGRKEKARIKDYNEKDLLILKLGVGGYRTEYDYTYDANGDWIKKKITTREGFLEPWKYSELRKNLLK